VRAPGQDTWWVLPPFFRYTRSARLRQVNAPWPFIQFSAGDMRKLYFWPLWGRKHAPPQRHFFFLWPIGSLRIVDRPDEALRRLLILPFVTYESRRTRPAGAGSREAATGPVNARRFKLWPLLSYRREGETWRLRVADLWPLKDAPGVARNYAPLWTLFRWEQHGRTREQELLWGLYRRRVEADGARRMSVFPLWQTQRGRDHRDWSLLKGLAGYRREGSKKWYRFLYCITLRREGSPPAPE
jgi:hypothetical protein